jgi:hypothetical protein
MRGGKYRGESRGEL